MVGDGTPLLRERAYRPCGFDPRSLRKHKGKSNAKWWGKLLRQKKGFRKTVLGRTL